MTDKHNEMNDEDAWWAEPAGPVSDPNAPLQPLPVEPASAAAWPGLGAAPPAAAWPASPTAPAWPGSAPAWPGSAPAPTPPPSPAAWSAWQAGGPPPLADGSTGGAPPSPPNWSPPPPPWGGPPSPWPGAPWPSTGWQPAPAPPKRAGRAGLALTVVAAIVAGFAGMAVGSRLARSHTSNTPSAASLVVPSAPSTGGSSTGTDPQVSSIAAKVSQSVVDINTKLSYQGASAAGTGLILTSSGDILTNNHVIDGSTSISVTLVDTGRSYTAKVVGTDPAADIAVIHIQGPSGLKPINTTATPVALGDSVIAIGNAGGVGGTPSVVTGTVSATDQTITASDPNGANAEQLNGLIQTNAPIQPGDSGGPLVNSSGQVIGINTAASSRNRFDSSASVGFAIPLANAVSVAKQIESGVATNTIHIGLPGFLGVSIDPSTGAATVAGVQPASPASAIGLQAGDTITTVDGKRIDAPTTLTTTLRAHRPGDKVSIGWTTTAGVAHTATATLMTGPAD